MLAERVCVPVRVSVCSCPRERERERERERVREQDSGMQIFIDHMLLANPITAKRFKRPLLKFLLNVWPEGKVDDGGEADVDDDDVTDGNPFICC